MENKTTSNFLENVYAIKLTDYLESLKIPPIMDDGLRVFYKSPFDKTEQQYLSIDKKANRFYDSALEKAGTIIDFGMAYHQCNLAELLTIIHSNYPVQTRQEQATSTIIDPDQELQILKVQSGIKDPHLLEYLKQLRIPLPVADQHCKQLHYNYYGEQMNGIGFPNDAQGFAIILPQGKLFTAPLVSSTIQGTSGKLDLYQDFTDFLSVVKLRPSALKEDNSVAILHDLSLFEPTRPFLEKHKQVNLYLHHNEQGRKYTAYAQWLDKVKYRDFSQAYQHHQSITQMCIATARRQREELSNNNKRKL